MNKEPSRDARLAARDDACAPQLHRDEPCGEAPDMRCAGRAAPGVLPQQAELRDHLEQEPDPDCKDRRHRNNESEDQDPDPIVREQQEMAPEHAGDGPRRSEAGHQEIPARELCHEDLRQRGGGAAEEIE